MSTTEQMKMWRRDNGKEVPVMTVIAHEVEIAKADGSVVRYRDVRGCIGYRVGTDGSVWSQHVCHVDGQAEVLWIPMDLAMLQGRYKYYYVHFSRFPNGKSRERYVHRLVLETFVGSCPEGMECCHNDGNSLNNNLTNLRWDTPAANNADRIRHGTARRCYSKLAKVTDEQAWDMHVLHDRGLTYREIAEQFPLNKANIGYIIRGQSRHHVKEAYDAWKQSAQLPEPTTDKQE